MQEISNNYTIVYVESSITQAGTKEVKNQYTITFASVEIKKISIEKQEYAYRKDTEIQPHDIKREYRAFSWTLNFLTSLRFVRKIEQIEKEERIFKTEAHRQKRAILKAYIDVIFNSYLAFNEFKTRIKLASVQARYYPQYTFWLYNFRVMADTLIFRANILCDDEEERIRELNALDYLRGMRLLERTTQVPKFYLDKVIVGLLNATKTKRGTIIDMKNINTKVEIGEDKVIIRFFNQT